MTRRLSRAVFWVLVAGLVAAGCKQIPLNISEAEWKKMTPAQKLEARKKQAEIDRALMEQIRREQAAAEAAERKRVAQIYASGKYGSVLECSLSGGVADFKPGWRKYNAVGFEIVRDEKKKLPLTSADGRTLTVHAQLQGSNTLKICTDELYLDSFRSGECGSFSAVSRDLEYGVTQRLSIKEIFNGAELRCAYRPTEQQKRLIILPGRGDRKSF